MADDAPDDSPVLPAEASSVVPLPLGVIDNYFKAAGITSTIPDEIKPVTVDEILTMFRQFEDRALDDDVRLLEAFRSLGAIVSINEWAYPGADGPIVVALPPRFKRAEQEIERRRKLRDKAADHAAKYAWPTVLYSPLNLDIRA